MSQSVFIFLSQLSVVSNGPFLRKKAASRLQVQELNSRVTIKITVKGDQASPARCGESGKIGVGPLPGSQVKLDGPLAQ